MTVLRACRLAQLGVVTMLGMAMLALAAPSRACACGALVPPPDGQATMNHEVALVHWDGSTENIVMQLGLNASTDNVALVVPTPTPATVVAAEKATFTELDSLTAPEIKKRRHYKLGSVLEASAPRAAAPTGAPNVLNQVHLGPLEATTLAGGDLAGLQKWLADNGYAIRPNVSAALDPYVRDSWSFVAMRLTSTAPIVGGLKPVRMTFQSPRLVYPMRLSVAAPAAQRVTIFTLTDHRQQRTDADASGQTSQVQFAGNVSGAVRDPLLRELAGNHGAYLTKMQIDIPKPAQITSDFEFGNAANDDPYRQVVYVDRDVGIPIEPILFVVLLFGAVLTAVVVIVVLRRRRMAGPPS
ncbi:hypothetical protein A9W99_08650 [Mycobacterium sp. 1164966.3]|uniref:DUF2330 domain-containing protein n=1 Tax=Mycobacterium sp. 1164966.3 TaxID=1856861 RepID=UPI0007FE3F52|nr:DUF2330 domain-containing protein [Mycobacterium sp. 1164966.3]OBA83387.1 hypothetical protein A9W99_08650 [Mycobacterium sp. 1164966.3]